MSLGKRFWLDALNAEGQAFRAALTSDDLDKPVPSCPEWTVRDLVGHLGTIYSRGRFHATWGSDDKPEHVESAEPPATGDVLRWWDEQFGLLLAALEEVEDDAPAWNWSVKPQQAQFWHRRMAQESAVHRWDAQMSVGLPEPIEDELAADCVDEVLDTWLPAGKIREPIAVTGAVRLVATDVEREWVARIRENGISLLDTGGLFDAEPEVGAVAEGTASDLALVLWGRVPVSLLTVRGEPLLVETLRVGA